MKTNSALLLIEFQNEWLTKKGKLFSLMQDKSLFSYSIDQAKKILATARNQRITVIHSGLSFNRGYKELGYASYGLRSHIPQRQTFMAQTEGSEFADDFKPKNNEFIVQGRVGGSAFAGSNLDAYLRNNQINILYIMGYALHVCVESTLRAAHDLGYEVIVINDACSAFNQDQQDYVVNNVIPHFGKALLTDEFLMTIGEK